MKNSKHQIRQWTDWHGTIAVERCDTFHHFSVQVMIHYEFFHIETSGQTAGMGHDSSGMQNQRSACQTLVQEAFNLDPFNNTLLLFCGRRRDRIKALYWEGDGFVLLYKRLESGFFQWPRSETEARALTPQQYRWLMEGLSVDQPKAHKPAGSMEIV